MLTLWMGRGADSSYENTEYGDTENVFKGTRNFILLFFLKKYLFMREGIKNARNPRLDGCYRRYCVLFL